MAISAEQWQTRLDAYLAAETAVLLNQEYEMPTANGTRRLVRADLAAIRAGIKECNAGLAAIARLSATPRGRTRYLVPDT